MPSQMAQWPFLARPRWPGVLTESGLCVEPLSVAPLQPFLPASALDSSRRSRGESGWTREAPGWAIPEAYRGSSGGWSHLDLWKPPARSTALSAAPSRSLRLFRGSRSRRHVHRSPVTGIPRTTAAAAPSAGNPSSLSQRVRSHQRRLNPDRRRSRRDPRHARPFPAPSAVSPRPSAAA